MLDFRDGARGGTCSSRSLSLPVGDGSPTKAKFNWLFLTYARGSFQVPNLYKKRPFTKIKCLVYIFQEWCSRGDLNPHAISIRPSSVRVYQFHHPSRCFCFFVKNMVHPVGLFDSPPSTALFTFEMPFKAFLICCRKPLRFSPHHLFLQGN